MDSITEHQAMKNIIQDRVTTYEDNVDSLYKRIISLEKNLS